MAKVNLYKVNGEQSGDIELSEALFSVEAKPGLIHEVLVAQDANSRVQYAHTKDRSQVAGTGKKPWKQKGTGRARHGSRRSPIWSGGGVTFGPNSLRNFTKKVNKKVRRKAIAMLLTNKAQNDKFIVVDSLASLSEKTTDVKKLRQALPGAGHKALIVTTPDEKQVVLAARNLPKTHTMAAHSLNVRDLLAAEYVIASEAALEIIQTTFSK